MSSWCASPGASVWMRTLCKGLLEQAMNTPAPLPMATDYCKASAMCEAARCRRLLRVHRFGFHGSIALRSAELPERTGLPLGCLAWSCTYLSDSLPAQRLTQVIHFNNEHASQPEESALLHAVSNKLSDSHLSSVGRVSSRTAAADARSLACPNSLHTGKVPTYRSCDLRPKVSRK
jgi:hypothetical protein